MKQFHLYKWIMISIFSVGVLCSCGGDSDAEEIDDYATDTSIAVTGSSSAITPVSAEIVCKANITQGGSSSIELGVMYTTDSEELAEFYGSKASTKNLVGNAYKVTLLSLKPNTTYYYRSYIASGGINNYGKIKSFTTQSVASPNTIQADTITAFSAYLHGKREITREYANEIGFLCYDGFVVSDRKDSIDFKGMFVSSDSYRYDNSKYKSYSNGNYRLIVNGLQPNCVYYYKAFSKINGGYTYGAVKSFTTSCNDDDEDNIVQNIDPLLTTDDLNNTLWANYQTTTNGTQYIALLIGFANGQVELYEDSYVDKDGTAILQSGTYTLETNNTLTLTLDTGTRRYTIKEFTKGVSMTLTNGSKTIVLKPYSGS